MVMLGPFDEGTDRRVTRPRQARSAMSSQATSAAINTLHTTTATGTRRRTGRCSRASDLGEPRIHRGHDDQHPDRNQERPKCPGLNGSKSVNHHPYARTPMHAAPTRTRRRRSPPSAPRAFMRVGPTYASAGGNGPKKPTILLIRPSAASSP